MTSRLRNKYSMPRNTLGPGRNRSSRRLPQEDTSACLWGRRPWPKPGQQLPSGLADWYRRKCVRRPKSVRPGDQKRDASFVTRLAAPFILLCSASFSAARTASNRVSHSSISSASIAEFAPRAMRLRLCAATMRFKNGPPNQGF